MNLPLLSVMAQTVPDSTAISIEKTIEKDIEMVRTLPIDQLMEHVTSWAITFGKNILIALVLYFVGRWLIRYIKKLLGVILSKRHMDLSLRSFIISLVTISLTVLLLVIIIGVLGIDTTSFIAIFASAGLAVGMALSGTLQNFAGGVMVLLFKPYKVGDTIEAMGQTGTVKEIQLFNTIINTPDNKAILLPNGSLSSGIINNYSREKNRRVEWIFSVGYGDSYELARQTLLDLMAADSRILPDPAPFVALKELADSSVNLVVRAWVDASDFWGVYFDLNEKVYKVFSEKNLNIPFPQMDVYLHPEHTAETK